MPGRTSSSLSCPESDVQHHFSESFSPTSSPSHTSNLPESPVPSSPVFVAADYESQNDLQSHATVVSNKAWTPSPKPLPSYTKSWGAHLSRPEELPEFYDDRIDKDHIFVFSVHPETGAEGPFYVTPRPCEHCSKVVRQVCSRTRPACNRCETAGKECVVREGWAKLSGPKCEKWRLRKSRDREEEGEPPLKRIKLDNPQTRRSRRPQSHPNLNSSHSSAPPLNRGNNTLSSAPKSGGSSDSILSNEGVGNIGARLHSPPTSTSSGPIRSSPPILNSALHHAPVVCGSRAKVSRFREWRIEYIT